MNIVMKYKYNIYSVKLNIHKNLPTLKYKTVSKKAHNPLG